MRDPVLARAAQPVQLSTADAEGPFGSLDPSLSEGPTSTWTQRPWIQRSIFLFLALGSLLFTYFSIRSARRRSQAPEIQVQAQASDLSAEIRRREELAQDLRERQELELRVRSEGQHGSKLTRQLLACSRQQIMQPEVIQPLEVLRKMVSMLSRLVPNNVTIQLREDSAGRPILMDPGQLEQVIVSLVVKASEAMPDGGHVELGCRNASDAEGRPLTILHVSDHGAGLDPDVRDHIFEPGYSTKRKARGLGLGSVQGIVLQSGGSLEVEENRGRGLSFHVGLPATSAAPRQQLGPAESSETPGVVALLVDDEVKVRRIVRMMLERGGVSVHEAGSHEEAMQLAKQHAAELDILVTDVIMPHMNGRELGQKIRELVPDIKMIFISGHFREELDERDLLDSHADFLPKPFDSKQLLARVAELTRSHPGPGSGASA